MVKLHDGRVAGALPSARAFLEDSGGTQEHKKDSLQVEHTVQSTWSMSSLQHMHVSSFRRQPWVISMGALREKLSNIAGNEDLRKSQMVLDLHPERS